MKKIFPILISLLIFTGCFQQTTIQPQEKVEIKQPATQIQKVPRIVPATIGQEETQPVTATPVITEPKIPIATETAQPQTYDVVYVVDGDTVDLLINNEKIRIRIIGINSNENGECYFNEAKVKAEQLLNNQKITLEKDPTQGELDKYGRTLGYLILSDGTNFGEQMILGGYAKEYTYNKPYKYQKIYKSAEAQAISSNLGLWSCPLKEAAPVNPVSPVIPVITIPETNETTTTNCDIKGNINSEGEKIYHVPGCRSYTQTIINESKGERYFCTEQQAISAGWRKALNCP